MTRKITTLLTGLMLLLLGQLVFAESAAINDRAALGDLKVGRGVFLIDIGDPAKLNFYLEVIHGTYKGMKSQGVEPDFVLVYIGPSVKYLSTSPAEEAEEAAGGVLTSSPMSANSPRSVSSRRSAPWPHGFSESTTVLCCPA